SCAAARQFLPSDPRVGARIALEAVANPHEHAVVPFDCLPGVETDGLTQTDFGAIGNGGRILPFAAGGVSVHIAESTFAIVINGHRIAGTAAGTRIGRRLEPPGAVVVVVPVIGIFYKSIDGG